MAVTLAQTVTTAAGSSLALVAGVHQLMPFRAAPAALVAIMKLLSGRLLLLLLALGALVPHGLALPFLPAPCLLPLFWAGREGCGEGCRGASTLLTGGVPLELP